MKKICILIFSAVFLFACKKEEHKAAPEAKIEKIRENSDRGKIDSKDGDIKNPTSGTSPSLTQKENSPILKTDEGVPTNKKHTQKLSAFPFMGSFSWDGKENHQFYTKKGRFYIYQQDHLIAGIAKYSQGKFLKLRGILVTPSCEKTNIDNFESFEESLYMYSNGTLAISMNAGGIQKYLRYYDNTLASNLEKRYAECLKSTDFKINFEELKETNANLLKKKLKKIKNGIFFTSNYSRHQRPKPTSYDALNTEYKTLMKLDNGIRYAWFYNNNKFKFYVGKYTATENTFVYQGGRVYDFSCKELEPSDPEAFHLVQNYAGEDEHGLSTPSGHQNSNYVESLYKASDSEISEFPDLSKCL